MQLLWMILLGLLAGAIAKLLMPGKDPGGWIVTALLGIGGSILGGYLYGILNLTSGGPAGLVGSVIGAMMLLWVYRVVRE